MSVSIDHAWDFYFSINIRLRVHQRKAKLVAYFACEKLILYELDENRNPTMLILQTHSIFQIPIHHASNFSATATCRSGDMAVNNLCASPAGKVANRFLVTSTTLARVFPSIEPYSIAAATALNTFGT